LNLLRPRGKGRTGRESSNRPEKKKKRGGTTFGGKMGNAHQLSNGWPKGYLRSHAPEKKEKEEKGKTGNSVPPARNGWPFGEKVERTGILT